MITAIIISFLAFVAWVESYAIRQNLNQLKAKLIHAHKYIAQVEAERDALN